MTFQDVTKTWWGNNEVEYLNFIRSNKRGHFKFKRFSQIQKFGNNLMAKKDGVIRVMFENVNSFPIDSLGDKYDYKYLNYLFQHFSIDIFGTAETQVNYALATSEDSVSERFF